MFTFIKVNYRFVQIGVNSSLSVNPHQSKLQYECSHSSKLITGSCWSDLIAVLVSILISVYCDLSVDVHQSELRSLCRHSWGLIIVGVSTLIRVKHRLVSTDHWLTAVFSVDPGQRRTAVSVSTLIRVDYSRSINTYQSQTQAGVDWSLINCSL